MELASAPAAHHPRTPPRHLQQSHVGDADAAPVALFCHSAANWDDSDFAALPGTPPEF